jgi:hypothetical protein
MVRHHAARPSEGPRRGVRYVAAALCLSVGVLYLVLLFLVADAEAAAGGENTYGAYLFLSVPYLVGGVLLATLDRRSLHVVGAAIQVLVVALFVMFGVGVFGPGVFEYEALSTLHMGLWAAVITGAQIVLFGLLSYLALTTSRSTTTPVPTRRAE